MIIGKWHLKDIQYKDYDEPNWVGNPEGYVSNYYYKFKANGTYEGYIGNTLTGTATWSYNEDLGTINLNGDDWFVDELTINKMIFRMGTSSDGVRMIFDK